MNFQPVCFIEASQATAAYVKQFRARLKDDKIEWRSGDQDLAILGEWKSAKRLLSKIEQALVGIQECARVTDALIYALAPNTWQDWHTPDHTNVRAWLSLLPSPGAMLFSGLEAHNPPVGQLTVVSRAVPFSVVNLGPCAAVWLVLDVDLPGRTS